VRPLTAQWVANAVAGTLVAEVDTTVTSVVKDSREAVLGSLYAAFVGEHVDGHDFVAQATAAGAVLSLVSQHVDAPHVLVDDVQHALGALARAYLALLRNEGELTVIGITGSNGKTTTKDLLSQVLPDVVAPVGSFNNEIGMPLTILRADADTRHLVLEMGASGPGHLTYLTSIAPLDIAVVLTVGSAHSGGYDSPEGIAMAKAELLGGLVPGGVAILNADDQKVAAMASAAQRVVTFGTADADIRAVDLTVNGGRASFAVADTTPRLGGDGGPSTSPVRRLTLVGAHHVTNALAAVAVARECGIDLDEASAAVAAARPLSAHRMAVTARADGVTFIDDSYNASPESMKAAMRALVEVAEGGRTFAVIGEMREMGPQSREAHWDVGHHAVRLGIDHLIVVGEGAKPAFDSAVREGSWGDEAAYVGTIGEAREFLERQVAAGDTVLIKASHGSGLWELADELMGESQ